MNNKKISTTVVVFNKDLWKYMTQFLVFTLISNVLTADEFIIYFVIKLTTNCSVLRCNTFRCLFQIDC